MPNIFAVEGRATIPYKVGGATGRTHDQGADHAHLHAQRRIDIAVIKVRSREPGREAIGARARGWHRSGSTRRRILRRAEVKSMEVNGMAQRRLIAHLQDGRLPLNELEHRPRKIPVTVKTSPPARPACGKTPYPNWTCLRVDRSHVGWRRLGAHRYASYRQFVEAAIGSGRRS